MLGITIIDKDPKILLLVSHVLSCHPAPAAGHNQNHDTLPGLLPRPVEENREKVTLCRTKMIVFEQRIQYFNEENIILKKKIF